MRHGRFNCGVIQEVCPDNNCEARQGSDPFRKKYFEKFTQIKQSDTKIKNNAEGKCKLIW